MQGYFKQLVFHFGGNNCVIGMTFSFFLMVLIGERRVINEKI